MLKRQNWTKNKQKSWKQNVLIDLYLKRWSFLPTDRKKTILLKLERANFPFFELKESKYLTQLEIHYMIFMRRFFNI